MHKLSNKEEKETEILSKRIMPKTDFKKVLEHDKLYYNTLNEALEYNIIKQDILGQKCSKVIATQTKDTITKNIDMLCDYAETKLKVLDFKGKLQIQRKMIEDKELHYENVFLPQFNQESKEAQLHIQDTLKKAKAISKEMNYEDKEFKKIIHKIDYELNWWSKCDKTKQKNEEYIIQIYKPLKRLLSAYKQKEEEVKEEAKYKV
jgi:hypothetical protein